MKLGEEERKAADTLISDGFYLSNNDVHDAGITIPAKWKPFSSFVLKADKGKLFLMPAFNGAGKIQINPNGEIGRFLVRKIICG